MKANRRRHRRRAAAAATACAALTATMASCATAPTATAFLPADFAARPLLRPSPTRASALLAEAKKPTIESINDENRHVLLRPPSAPSRPVLVDAMAPWCGPCKLLDKVLRKARPRYDGRVDFVRWNVNDKENTVELKELFLSSGFELTKLPSLIVFKDGAPVAVRAGMANEYQLDKFLEDSLPELEKTFDEDGIKMVPLPRPEEEMEVEVKGTASKAHGEATTHAKAVEEDILKQMSGLAFGEGKARKEVEKAIQESAAGDAGGDCTDPIECWDRVDQTFWQNRTVVPAMEGVLLPAREYGSP